MPRAGSPTNWSSPTNKLTHIFLDAGNTLVYVNMSIVSRALARRGVAVSPSVLWRGEHRARRIVDDPDLITRSNDATRWETYFTAILAICGARTRGIVGPVLADLHAYHDRNNLWEVVPEEMPSVLDRLRRRYRLSVISNSNGSVRQKLIRVGLAPYFQQIIDSEEEGIEKPDPRLFRIAMERAHAVPSRSLYVGDLYHIDVVGARAAGMHAILLDPGDVQGDRPVARIPALSDLGRLPISY